MNSTEPLNYVIFLIYAIFMTPEKKIFYDLITQIKWNVYCWGTGYFDDFLFK